MQPHTKKVLSSSTGAASNTCSALTQLFHVPGASTVLNSNACCREVCLSSQMANVGGGGGGAGKMADKEKKKKESILDLSKYIDKTIRVKFQGGREASGVLKGFDPLLNLVLDGTIEYMRDPDDQYKLTEDTRQLGLVVCRGTSVVLICPQDGMEAIPNPFIQQQDG